MNPGSFCLAAVLLAAVASQVSSKSSKASSTKDTLVYAHVIYRHGDRAPGHLYPNDLYGMAPWPQGLQELSTKGMMQHFKLGKYLKKRYSKLLSKRYVDDEIYIRSSDKNRALQSAASDLAGLYPPSKEQVWNPKLDWQPVPIHSVPTDDDNLLVVDNPCPKYDAVFLEQTKPTIDAYNKQYASFFEYVKANSGLTKLDFWSIGDIYDPLWCEYANGYKLPKWASAVWNKTTGQTVFGQIVDLKNIAKNSKYNSDEKALLTGGFLLGDIAARLKSIGAGVNSTKELKASKLIMYSAHDDTLMALLYAMNVVEQPFLVPYAAAVLVDLYQSTDGRYFVETSYKNNTPPVTNCKGKKCKDDMSSESSEEVGESMLKYIIPGCEAIRCPLETFLASLADRTSFPKSKRDSDCGIKEVRARLRPSVIRNRL